MKVLDLCCGAGGCSMGYDWAGFDVVGVDEAPQKHYPFEFIQADAFNYLRLEDLSEFDLIHASPPCQAYSKVCQVHRNNGKVYPDILKLIRSYLIRTDKPFVIENVPGAPLYRPVMLCGTMFDLKVIRHRLFESNFYIKPPGRCNHNGTVKNGDYFTVCGNGSGKDRATVKVWSDAMDIHWMTRKELTQAIPPAYTRYIGNAFKTWVAKGGSNRLFGSQ